MTFSATCDIVSGITVGVCKSDKRHIVYIDNPCEIIIIIIRLGTELIDTTVSQQYCWTNLRDNIRTNIKVCNTCQKNKKQTLKYGKFTDKKA